MKIKPIIPFLIGLLLLSCGGETVNSENGEEFISDSLSIDSASVDTLIELEIDPNRPEIDVEKLLAKTNQEFELPLLIDSTFIEKYALTGEDAKYNLSSKEAKYLSFSFTEGDLVSGGGWRINTFIEIDSIKKAGKYEGYLNQLDLGQARYCIGHVIGKVAMNTQTTLLLWNLDYATYEACPYGYGTYVYGTIITNGVGSNTCLIAEKSGGGDPPSWGDTYMQSELTDSSLTTFCLDSWGEYGYDGEDDFTETQERTELVKVNSFGFELIKRGGDYNY